MTEAQMEHAIEIITGTPLVSLSGALVGGWLAMTSFVLQGKMGQEVRYVIRSLVFRSMGIGLVLSVIIILQEAHAHFPVALGLRNCAKVFVLALAISGIHGAWWIAFKLKRR